MEKLSALNFFTLSPVTHAGPHIHQYVGLLTMTKAFICATTSTSDFLFSNGGVFGVLVEARDARSLLAAHLTLLEFHGRAKVFAL